MASGKSVKSLLSRRRRADDEGEDEDGPASVAESQSEGSVDSELVDDGADASTLGGGEASGKVEDIPDVQAAKPEVAAESSAEKKARKTKKKSAKKAAEATTAPSLRQPGAFKALADTEAMMNGLKIGEDSEAQQAVDFESMGHSEPAANVLASSTGQSDAPGGRQRWEHEEYRRARDVNPAFIPNRGNFFMHDTRTQNGRGTPPVRGVWTGRGRGRGGSNVGGHVPQGNSILSAEKGAEQPWKHDLHDTINEEPPPAAQSRAEETSRERDESARLFPRPRANHQAPPPVINFSSTTLVGKVQIRVLLPGMKAPMVFTEVPWKEYTRMPDHRPPLRRDKPVRVSLAGHIQRYIFPSVERSFIFIPRQLRANQQGYVRNAYHRHNGGQGYTSRRTSAYGGSVYASSVAASRRSSFASVRDNAFSPVGSYGGGPPMPPNRIIPRYPHGPQSQWSFPTTPVGAISGRQTPSGMQIHTYPLPQQPVYQGTPTTTMHQPRPQKQISVTGIESPAAALQQTPPPAAPQHLQPFHNQLPVHMQQQQQQQQQRMMYNQHAPVYYPAQQQQQQQPQQFAYPPQQQQPSNVTPLSGIPEQAIHAPAFQPPGMHYGQQQPPPQYYPQPYPQQQQGFYYPPPAYPPMGPMYPPQQQTYHHLPTQPPPVPAAPLPPVETQDPAPQPPAAASSGILAHESNGMVFYVPAGEAVAEGETALRPAEGFVPAYARPGLVFGGAGGRGFT